MYVPKQEMKINKFRLVVIPKNRDYMVRFGAVTPGGNFSGEEVAPVQQNKVDDLETWSRYAESKLTEDSSR